MLLVMSNGTTVAGAEAAPTWHFREELLPILTRAIPKILESQDKATGRFGSGVWIINDQEVLFSLAVAWSLKDPKNPYYHKSEVLNAILAGGDALIAAQDANGQWLFQTKDGATWGQTYMPWTYSRWIRTFGLIKDVMPAEQRTRWEKALILGYDGIARTTLDSIQNVPAHHAMGLYLAGKLLNRPEWSQQAAAFLKKVVDAQDKAGFWSEHYGPVINYNFAYIEAVGIYYSLSHDAAMLPALERAARYHANFTYPNGFNVETIDERNPYVAAATMPGVGFTFSPEGRGYMRQQFNTKPFISPDAAATLLLHGEEGPTAPTVGQQREHQYILGEDKAVVRKSGPWFTCLSAYCCSIVQNRWILDRQNFISLYHDKTGLILGGGNTKLQPLWSTFTVGDTSQFAHKPGDENPNFLPPSDLLHVPTNAVLNPKSLDLALTYGPTQCGVRLELVNANMARLIYSVASLPAFPVEAHVTLIPAMGETWETGTGKKGTISDTSFRLSSEEIGGWFSHNGWRVSVPPGASIVWPALQFHPYAKGGVATSGAWGPVQDRIALVLPFQGKVLKNVVTVEVK